MLYRSKLQCCRLQRLAMLYGLNADT